ncbi:MAG: oligosaccharide flippase family protein, partial [Gemmatimonadota bacterium]
MSGAATGAGHAGIGARFAALGGGEALARLAAFAATVYLARTLGPSLFGSIAFATAILLYLTQLADAGVELVGVPLVARAQDRIDAVVGPVFSARLTLAFGLTLVTIVVGLFLLPQPDGVLLAGYALTLPLAAASTRWVHLGLERTGWIALARTAGEIVTLALTILLVYDATRVGYVPFAAFAGQALLALLLIVGLRRLGLRLPLRFDWQSARPTFERSRHLVAFTLLGLVLFNFTLVFIRLARGGADAGVFSAAYTLIAFGANLIVAFAHTVMPTLARLDHDIPGRNAVFQRSLQQAFTLALPAGVGATLVADQILGTVFGDRFEGGVMAMRILAWYLPLAALRELPVVALIAAGEERTLLRVNAISAACNVALAVALIPRFGLVGAAAATAATEVIRLLLAARAAGRAGFPTIQLRVLAVPTAAALVMAAMLLLVRPAALWTSVPLGALGYGAALVAL